MVEDEGSSPAAGKQDGTKPGKKGKKTPSPAPPKTEGLLPSDIVPLFLATKSQEIFQCVCDQDVTEENPMKLIKKEDIINDMKMRAAISDFHPVKKIVLDYPGEELLVVYDPDFQHGQNFFLCITEEAKLRLTSPEAERTASAAADSVAAEEEQVYVYKPPESKEWVDQGGYAEVSDEMIVDNRPKIRYCASRVRREFGAAFKFKDRDADITSPAEKGLAASYLTCASYADPNFTIKKAELDTAVQAVPEMTDDFSQTDLKHPINACVQYEARTVSEEDAKKLQSTEEFGDFIKDAAPRFELAIQQNLIMNIFFDDWEILGDVDTNFGSKSDSHLKEYQSFTDLEYSKDKTISYVDWHPQIKGVMAVACSEKFSFDERIDNANRLLMNPSLVLIWSFADPIHPQLLLEGPDDICCFKFCPTNPNIIAGGCTNGQLILWDITEFADKISSSSRGNSSNTTQKKAAMFGEEAMPDIPTVRYCAVSGIENSHRNLITSLEWLPDHLEFNRLGLPIENRLCECVQIITCGTDGNVMIWDTRPPKTTGPAGREAAQAEKKPPMPFGVAQTFKHLDLTWKPLLKLSMPKTDSSGDYSPMKFSIAERQGVRDHVPMPTASKQEGLTKVPSAKQKPLENVSTHYFIGTEDGEIVYADFKLEKDSDTGKLNVSRPTWSVASHDGPVNTLQRNPFFSDFLLSVGGWTFSLWRENILSSAILQSACAPKLYTAGHWSLTRPAVFFLGTKDGNVEVWDLLDRTHEPIMVQNVTAVQITHIVPYVMSKKQHLLGVADNVGTLHILEIPWNLRHPASNEEQGVKSYLERETTRIEYFEQRHGKRAAEKSSDSSKKKPTQEKSAEESEEALLEEYKTAYESYQTLERKLLQELGIAVEEENPEV